MQEIMQDNKFAIPVELIGKFYQENREESVRFLNTAADFLHRNPEAFGEQSAPYVDFLYSLWITNVIDEIAAGRLFISECFQFTPMTEAVTLRCFAAMADEHGVTRAAFLALPPKHGAYRFVRGFP